MDKLWRFTSCGILWMLNLLSWFRCCTVEWHYRKIGFTSSCCHHFIPRCIQIQFCQRCVTLSTEAAIHQRTCAFRFISFYCFYSVYSVFIVHLCLHTKYSSMRFSFYFFFFFQLNWPDENKELLTSLQKDFGMRQGGSQELLSTGGFMAGQPPEGARK